MKKIFLALLTFAASSSFAVDSGFYLGLEGGIDSHRFDYRSSSPIRENFNNNASKADYGVLAGYTLPLPFFHLAVEGGVDLKTNKKTFIQNKDLNLSASLSSRRIWSADLLPGLPLLLDHFLLNAVLGLEKTKLTFSESTSGVSTYHHSLKERGWRYGLAASFYPLLNLGFRLSVVQTVFKKQTFANEGVSFSIKPRFTNFALALIWEL